MRKLVSTLTFLTICLSGCSNINSPLNPALETFQRGDDYDYGLANLEAANSHSVTFTQDGFTWPSVDQDADTAFLEFFLLRSSGLYPAIEINAGGTSLNQYFEQGGQGRRYLDVSPLLQANLEPGEFVRVTGSGAAWYSGRATVIAFRNPPLKDRRVLVVAPHPDDAEIAAFGVYQTANADVVTVTAGDAGGFNFISLWPDAGEHYRAKGKIRTLDSLTVPLLAGLQSNAIRNLGYYDATLRQLWLARPNAVEPPLAVLQDPGFYRRLNFDAELRERKFESTWQALVADLRRELERVQPEIVFAPHPRLDRHLDHQFTALALFEALFQRGEDSEIYLYTNHAIGNEAFPLGHRQGMTGLPAWRGEGLHLKRLYSHLLTDEDQRMKLVALEAMHDLRPFDLRDGREPEAVPAIYDYFRRAARPNEIFFVTNLDGARAIYNEFFEQ